MRMGLIVLINSTKRRKFTAIAFLVTMVFLSISVVSANDIPTQGTTSPIWTVVESGYEEAVFRSIQFINDTHGWVAGRSSPNSWNGIILGTDDGGVSWDLQYHDESQEFGQIYITDDETVWVTAFGGLFFSNDSGNSWSFVNFPEINTMVSAVSFYNCSLGWASTNQKVFSTDDGGLNWTVCESWSFDDTFRRMFIHSDSLLHGIGFDGIYHSTDGGETWERVFSKGGWSLSFSTSDRGFAVADNMLAETSDGVTWTETPIPMNSPIPGFRAQYLSDILFIDEFNGWIVGDAVSVMHTPDGGVNWYSQSVSESVSRMMTIDFYNDTHGWSAGFGGDILRTTSGNSFEERLWRGVTDPLFISIVSLIGAALTTVLGTLLYIRWIRRKRTDQQLSGSQLPTER